MENICLDALIPDTNDKFDTQLIERICNDVFQPDEIHISSAKQRIIGKLSQFTYNYDCHCFNIQLESQNFNSIHRFMTSLNVNKHGTMAFSKDFSKSSPFEYDLLFTYNVYSHRLNRIKANLNLAVELTMRKLNNKINNYESIKNCGISSNLYMQHLIYMYSYLFMNCYVFNILLEPSLIFEKFRNIPVDIKYLNVNLINEIDQDLKYITNQIKKKILAL